MNHTLGKVCCPVSAGLLAKLDKETSVRWAVGQKPASWTPPSTCVICFDMEAEVLTHHRLELQDLGGPMLHTVRFVEIVGMFCPVGA